MGRMSCYSFGAENGKLYKLENRNGMQVTVTDFGARVVEVLLPVDGVLRNVSLSADSVEDYLAKDIYVGASVAPVAGRISGAKAEISGAVYHFTENESGRTLHSGVDTVVEQFWDAELFDAENKIVFSQLIPDGKNGFPGNVSVKAIYQLTDDNELKVSYEAVSDKATLFNPTNHVYFNLSGDFTTSVKDHQLKIVSSRYVPLGNDNMPLGHFEEVAGTAFDFREFASFAQGLDGTDAQTQLVNGFDHPWALDTTNESVEVISPDQKVKLVIKTNQPAVVIYTYNHGPTNLAACHGAFSLECQGFPNACNIKEFGSIELEAGQAFQSEFSYRFEF